MKGASLRSTVWLACLILLLGAAGPFGTVPIAEAAVSTSKAKAKNPKTIRSQIRKVRAQIRIAGKVGNRARRARILKRLRNRLRQLKERLARIFEVKGTLGTNPGAAQDTGQDAFRFRVGTAKTKLTIILTPGNATHLDPEIFLYGPNVAPGPGKTNRLTGTPFGLDTAGLGGAERATITVNGSGNYVVAVEDSRTSSQQVSGVYRIRVSGSERIGRPTLVHDEGPESD